MFADSVARALSVVMLNPTAPLTVGEIQRLGHEKEYRVTASALETMAKRGLLVRSSRGERPAYAPNKRDPHYPVALASAIVDLPWIACLQAAGIDVRAIESIYAYGSILKGAARADSDLDIFLVAPDALAKRLLGAFEPIEKMIGRTVDASPMSLEEVLERRRRNDTYLSVVRGGLRLYGEVIE